MKRKERGYLVLFHCKNCELGSERRIEKSAPTRRRYSDLQEVSR